MIRVYVICEGQTEEEFIKNLLQAELFDKNIQLIPTLLGKPGHKGGCVSFERLARDIQLCLLRDKKAYCSTFFDYYGLSEAFPGKNAVVASASITDKATAISDALRAELLTILGDNAVRRFIPYVQMYEFEGLLFSDPQIFARAIGYSQLTDDFMKIRQAYTTPEMINDSPNTAPSKRILHLVPAYEKPLMGSLAALEIGVDNIRRECQLFDQWLLSIEALEA